MKSGIILIDKPTGMTSFGVVARVRRHLSSEAGKKVKVGHTGTLDPFATGLMIIVVGEECKNASSYSKLDKVYEATIRLGQTSSTGDTEGELTDVSDIKPSLDNVKSVLQEFTGDITQQPPIYSAIKINGRRAYDLAREGQVVEMPTRIVSVYKLELVDYSYPDIKIRVHVSSGTYIRTLAQDIGSRLGTGAYCLELRRTDINKWSVADSESITKYEATN